MNYIFVLLFVAALAEAKPYEMAVEGNGEEATAPTEADGGMEAAAGTMEAGSVEATEDGEAADYGAYETKCVPYYETSYVERCEHYEDEVCYTTHTESCVDVEGENCRAIVSSKHVRQCINVTELICGLKETIHYDVVQAVFTVQKCHKVIERVCDTVYEPQLTSKDDFQCIALSNPKCYAEDKTVYDKTCRTSTHFDCSYGYGAPSAHYESAAVTDYASGGHEGDYGYGGGDYGHQYDSKCKRTYDTKCYTTPRSVTSQVCKMREDKACEKLSERIPLAAEKQVCHDEVKKVCELEQRQQPKQIKKYTYTKQCRGVPKKVCENADVKQLVPSCVPTMRKECHYTPVEKCEAVPKQYCHKVPTKVKKQKCETVKKTTYPPPSDPYH